MRRIIAKRIRRLASLTIGKAGDAKLEKKTYKGMKRMYKRIPWTQRAKVNKAFRLELSQLQE